MAVGGNSVGGSSSPPENDNKRSERRKDLPQYDNVGQVKKKEKTDFVKWLNKMFFNGRTWKEIVLDIAENQLVPEIKDGVRNMLVSMIDMRIYKNDTIRPSSNRNGYNNNGYGTRNYVDYSSASAQKAKLEENKKKDEETVKNGYDNPAFYTKSEAIKFLNSMHDYANNYDDMSVFDIAYMSNKKVDYTWDSWGWTSEQILAIKEPTYISSSGPNGYKWCINLPPAKELDY